VPRRLGIGVGAKHGASAGPNRVRLTSSALVEGDRHVGSTLKPDSASAKSPPAGAFRSHGHGHSCTRVRPPDRQPGCADAEPRSENRRFLWAMQAPLHRDLIFPMNDAPSAAFMMLKAACLYEAGIITRSDKGWVDARARAILVRGQIPLGLSAGSVHMPESRAAQPTRPPKPKPPPPRPPRPPAPPPGPMSP
jgi:hypothetical protein